MERYKFSVFTILMGLGILASICLFIYVANWWAVIMASVSLILIRRIAILERLVNLHEKSFNTSNQIIKAFMRFTGQDN